MARLCSPPVFDWCIKFHLSRNKMLKARLHGGGEPQVGEVTRLAVVEKENAFTCNLTTPGC